MTMRKTVFICLLAAALLCGCSGETAEGEAFSETTVAAEENTAYGTVSTEASVSSFTEYFGSTDTENGKAAVKETVISEKNGETFDMPPDFYKRLYDIVDAYQHFNYYDISLAYRDIETGFEIMINPDCHYYSASVIKAPYMLYIYRLALAGKADLEQKTVYTENFRREGTGVLKDMEFGTEFTVEELIGYCLEESDNSAFAMLKELFPEEGYEEFTASLGVCEEDSRVRNGQICCKSALIFSKAIYDFIGEENPYSENMRYHMTHSRNAMIYGGDGAEVVRKYGWYEGFFHDMAILYGKKDYLLTIMTDLDMLEIDKREYGIFRDLSLLFADYAVEVRKAADGGDTVIIKIPKWRDSEMKLPNDPYMLLSVVNMKLRDRYKSFDELCEDMDANAESISMKLERTGYIYDAEANQFVPAPDETTVRETAEE